MADNDAPPPGPSAGERALGVNEILNNILEQLEREHLWDAARMSRRWAHICARLLWHDPPAEKYANKPPRIIRAYRGAVRTLYAPQDPGELTGWTFPGVRLLHLPYDYVRSVEEVRRVLGRCGARLRTLVVAPDGEGPVDMSFISFRSVSERDFVFYQNDVQGFSVPAQHGTDEADDVWEGLGDEDNDNGDDGQQGGDENDDGDDGQQDGGGDDDNVDDEDEQPNDDDDDALQEDNPEDEDGDDDDADLDWERIGSYHAPEPNHTH
jgi:hypothetical protein